MPRICTVQILASLFLLPMLLVSPARADNFPSESQRTVTWYVAHPDAREKIRRYCLNDPGHLQQMPDCINASRAELNAAASEAQQRAGDMSSPYTTTYWNARPNERAFKLTYCHRMTPQQQASNSICLAAEQSVAHR
jgi:hypothetical protein